MLTLVLNQKTTPAEPIGLFTDIEDNQRYHIIETIDEPFISTDYAKNDYSAIIDIRWIQVKNDNYMELVYWYDNEWGYSSRIVDMIGRLSGVI